MSEVPTWALLAYDYETTHKEPTLANVVQAAALMMVNHNGKWRRRRMLNTLCKPPEPIPAEAAEIHHITDDKVRWAVGQAEVLAQLRNVVAAVQQFYPQLIIAGHNHIRYDNHITTRLSDDTYIQQMPQIDTYHLAMRIAPGGKHKLGLFYEWLTGKEPIDAHDAMADVTMVSEIIEVYCEKEGHSLASLASWLSHPALLTTYPWGKHAGTPCDQVPISYWKWLASTSDGLPQDMEYTMNHHLSLARNPPRR